MTTGWNAHHSISHNDIKLSHPNQIMPKAKLSQSFVDAVNQDSNSTESKGLLVDVVIQYALRALDLCEGISVNDRIEDQSKARKKQDNATVLQQQEQRTYKSQSHSVGKTPAMDQHGT